MDPRGQIASTPIGLKQNYPNPFTSGTSIPVEIGKPGHVSLRVYNHLGKEVAVLLDEKKTEGEPR